MLSMDFSGGYSGFFFFDLENMSDAIHVSSMISEIPLPDSFSFFEMFKKKIIKP
jgi:hypothetical protein